MRVVLTVVVLAAVALAGCAVEGPPMQEIDGTCDQGGWGWECTDGASYGTCRRIILLNQTAVWGCY